MKNARPIGMYVIVLALMAAAATFITLSEPAAIAATTFDAVAAEALMKSSKCSTCHATEREKSAPSLVSIAKKYEYKPEAMEKLYKHLTNPTEIVVDGEKEEHKMVKPKDEAATRNLIRWILSLTAK